MGAERGEGEADGAAGVSNPEEGGLENAPQKRGPVKRVGLRWTGEAMIFEGSVPDGPATTIDSAGTAGPSPMDGLLLSLAGCMGIDVLDILRKGRVAVESLEVDAEGRRAPEPPRRYENIRLVYRVQGPTEDDRAKLDRAVALSRERYCSVLHTLRPDIELDIRVERL